MPSPKSTRRRRRGPSSRTKPEPALVVVLDLARPEALKFLRAPDGAARRHPDHLRRRSPQAGRVIRGAAAGHRRSRRASGARRRARPRRSPTRGEFAHTAGELEARARAGDRAARRQRVRRVAGDPRSRWRWCGASRRAGATCWCSASAAPAGNRSRARSMRRVQHRDKPFVKIECAAAARRICRRRSVSGIAAGHDRLSRGDRTSCRPKWRSASWSTIAPARAPTPAPTSASSPAPRRASTTGSRAASCAPIWSRRSASSGSSCRRCVSEPRTSRCWRRTS